MIRIFDEKVFNFEDAIDGARNPLNSWDKSDSRYYTSPDKKEEFVIGDADMKLLTRLISAGESHRKFMRQIFVSCKIQAPLYWWKEASTYKVGTTTNSQSTMHTIHKKPFTLDDFSHEHLFKSQESGEHNFDTTPITLLQLTIEALNEYREEYLKTKDKDVWWQMIQLLPSSYNQIRTWTGNYENLYNMYHQRKNHKLDEWNDFCHWIETLPYAKELIIGEDENNG